ncbi:FUSC family protein [Holzapfeliella sp. He02]|uniref:FUSC family protein n=1 Tax=Holzapfeliella saturejae TaxID=3082953 RepID=A0ABU8SHW0_9LACO
MHHHINWGDMVLKLSNFLALGFSITFMLIINNIQLGTLTIMGSIFFYYYVPQQNKAGIKTTILASMMGIIAYVLVSFSTLIPWLTPLVLSLICGISYFYSKMWRLVGPGPFFLVMISCIAGVHSFINLQVTFVSILFLLMGCSIAILLAIVNDWLLDRLKYPKLKDNTAIFTLKIPQIPVEILFKSFFYGGLIFLTFYIGENLKLFNYYWIVLSCASILQAESKSHAIKRHQHYILGTIIGCLISYLLLSLPLTLTTTIILLIIFHSLVYWKIKTNFLVGNFFTTPMAILVVKLNYATLNSTAIWSRFIAIVIGTSIALLSIYLFNYLKSKCITPNQKLN